MESVGLELTRTSPVKPLLASSDRTQSKPSGVVCKLNSIGDDIILARQLLLNRVIQRKCLGILRFDINPLLGFEIELIKAIAG